MNPPICHNQSENSLQPEQPAAFLPESWDIRAGAVCPRCADGVLDYDGLLNLVCPVCNWTDTGGSFT